MGVVGWIVAGLLAGGLARWVTGSERRGCIGTMLVGVLGGLLGGALFQAGGDEGITGFDVRSIFVAFVGACVLLLVLRVVAGRRV